MPDDGFKERLLRTDVWDPKPKGPSEVGAKTASPEADSAEWRKKKAYEVLENCRKRVNELRHKFELAKTFFDAPSKFKEAVGVYFKFIELQTQFADRKNTVLLRALKILHEGGGEEDLNQLIKTAEIKDIKENVDLPSPYKVDEFISSPKEFLKNILASAEKPVPVETPPESFEITKEDRETLRVFKSKDIFICKNGHGSLRESVSGNGGLCSKCGELLDMADQGRNEFGRQIGFPCRSADPNRLTFADKSPGEVKIPIWLDKNTPENVIVHPIAALRLVA